jgi:hypothetical protein
MGNDTSTTCDYHGKSNLFLSEVDSCDFENNICV